MRKVRLKLGEMLIKAKLITKKDLDRALEIQKRDGGWIGEILTALGVVSERDITATLGKQLDIPYASFDQGLLRPALDQDLEKLVPEGFARGHQVLPLARSLKSLTVALIDPLNLIVIDNLKKMTGCQINPLIATKTDILKAINEFYGGGELFREAIKGTYQLDESGLVTVVEEEKAELSLDKLMAKAGEAPVTKLVNLIIMEAVRERASDIHLEPFEKKLSLRYRIDGHLYDIPPPSQHLLLPLVSRIKILSKLDIAEKRLPQDGGFIVKTEDRLIDLRVSTIPVIHGEKVVIRILDRSTVPQDIKELGFESQALAEFEKAVKKPFGLIFITGPTGSGKTTTLYAALRRVYSPEKNIVTIEDPVEYRLAGINQVQAKPQIGLTFANGLRAFLRQDPDILMVGEVRDLETAQICIRAALTGHLVFSTLHTNDAAGAISRLTNIGIEPYLVISSLNLVLAQRLIRKLCPECKEEYQPSPQQVENFGLGKGPFYRAKGCDYCRQSGYRDRVGIFEVMPVNDEIRELITKGAAPQLIEQAAREIGMMTLLGCALEKVKQGITSLEEALGVTVGG